MQFSYRMDGRDWSPFLMEKNTMFLAVGSRNRVFEVRARDKDLNVDPTPATLEFTVVPPVWRQPWFVGLMAVLVGVIGVQAARILQRNRHRRRTNEDLKREMAERERAEASQTTRVPCAANARAVAAPIPELAPVTIATFPESDCMIHPP